MTHTGRRTEATAISQWLTSTTRHPDIAEKDWAAGRPAILRTGIIYDAVRMPMELVHAAVWSTVPDVVGGALAEVLDGPVVCHPGRWYYALVPPGTCEVWRSPVAAARGRGGWLGIPRVDRTAPAPVDPYWAVPVARIDRLCLPAAVNELLRVGRERYEGATGGVHSTAYVAVLEHAEECTACATATTASPSTCAVGTRLRKAERAARR
ncbi:hypothetical protein ACIOJD_07760 [Streptomyces sp. NPDC088116]|uniref:hypothetical protein n=1 Tax=Streptomyces sp. NPDC088116 TaxID=3365825 RepID=UPI00382192A5